MTNIIDDFIAIGAVLRDLDGRESIACESCEDGGWECYGIGIGDPHFQECTKCGNPKGLPSP
jgi:hypothetical protein